MGPNVGSEAMDSGAFRYRTVSGIGIFSIPDRIDHMPHNPAF